MRKITFIIAPTIPNSEREALEKHILEAGNDPDYTVVTNYEVKAVELGEDEFLLAAADGIPLAEVMLLRSKFDAIKAGGVPPVIVVNYEIDPLIIARA
jgi:hypothetical protein